MHTLFFASAAAFAFLTFLPSDPASVYAVLDKVVLQPEAAPTSIELHGAFALAEGRRGQHYRAPQVGVLRFQLGKDAEASRAQWRDLQAVAGKGTIVSFGTRHEMLAAGAAPVRVLAADEPPGDLPTFTTGWGVHALTNVNYGPARELALLPRCLPVDLGSEKGHPDWPARPVVFSCTNCGAGDDDLRYVFLAETSDGERVASGLVSPGKGITTWTVVLALQVGEKVTWSVHVVGAKVERAPLDRASFVVPASAVERRQ